MSKSVWEKLTRGTPELFLVRTPCPGCKSGRNTVVARGIDFEYFSCSNIFSFVRCDDCGTAYLNPRPRRSEYDIIYPNNYYSFVEGDKSERHNTLVQRAWDVLEKRRLKLFWKLLGKSNKKILDMGCGTGRLLKLLKKYGHPEWQLAGVESGLPEDFNLDGIDDARIYNGFFEEAEFEEAPFDLIVAQQVIEHAFEPSLMLEKTYNNLVPGGYAIFDTPNFNGIDRKIFSKSCWGGYHFPRHLTLFTPQTFGKLAVASGFEIVSCTNLASPVFWVLSVHNFLISAGVPPRWAAWIHYQTLPLICISTFIELFNLIARGTSNMRIIIRKPLGRK